MITRSRRICKKKDISKVFYGKRLVVSPRLAIYYCQTHQRIRAGFIVGKKTARKAVERNRIRRLLREAVRSELEIREGGFDILFVAQAGAKKAVFSEIREDVERAFFLAGIKKKK